jgi:hypothetical protein
LSADPRRTALDAQVVEWMQEPLWGDDDERFETLALALFAFQFEHCAPYRRFCEGRGHTPASVERWQDVPPVPTGAFKELALRCFPEQRTECTFRTSGTSTHKRGELHLDTLAVYEASLLPTFCRFLLPDLTAHHPEATLLVLAPSPGEARDSSLSHMFGVAIREIGAEGSSFFVERGELEFDALRTALAETPSDAPLLLCGTAFAFVHLADSLVARGEQLKLPPRTRIMETGGFKGHSRSVPQLELYELLEARLGIALERIVNQYGMTELGSQFYDSVLVDPEGPRRKLAPPWTRVRLLDSETGREAAPGEPGALFITDLANTGSVCAIQTTDIGRQIGDGFEVLGRDPGAEARGCSIAADQLLGGGGE